MKIWILGANGMLGSQVERLLKDKNLSHLGKDSERIDITKREEVRSFAARYHVTHIINCAAYTQVDRAESEQQLAHQINAVGPENLGIIAKELGIRVVHFSTDYVFDGNGPSPYDESHHCKPLNVYGMSKWEGEKKLLAQLEEACIIRTSWLFGLNGKNFVETMLRLMQEKETLRIVSDQTGRPTFSHDLAEAALMLLNQSGIFHFANANQTSWYHFATEIYHSALSLGYRLKVKTLVPIATSDYPTPAKRPAYSALSTQKFETSFQCKPRIWQDALKDYLRQYQQQQSLSKQ